MRLQLHTQECRVGIDCIISKRYSAAVKVQVAGDAASNEDHEQGSNKKSDCF